VFSFVSLYKCDLCFYYKNEQNHYVINKYMGKSEVIDPRCMSENMLRILDTITGTSDRT
jgi:hypothetical protein